MSRLPMTREEAETMEAVEDYLDNAQHEEEGFLCAFCPTNRYDGKVGRVHLDGCILKAFRAIINRIEVVQ